MELMQASNNWAHRPDDQRFLCLLDMRDHFDAIRRSSTAKVISSRALTVAPEGTKGLVVQGPNGGAVSPTHWAFGQLANLAGAPANYLRSLPSEMAADCINYGIQVKRDVEEIGVLLYKNGGPAQLKAATGPKYGRIWNSDVLHGLTQAVGNGRTGQWTVPGEFGQAVPITKDNTTLFAGDRDMFVFLADEKNRITMPDRRGGRSGDLARGFFIWNSEVGSATFGVATFLFDYVCSNRIVWGAQEVKELRLRHTSAAPDRFLEQALPALEAYADSSARNVLEGVEKARAKRLDNVEVFLRQRFSKSLSEKFQAIHMAEEERPIETLWDAATAITAHARSIEYQNDRVEMERKAGDILSLAR